jgi:hypothetical protein
MATPDSLMQAKIVHMIIGKRTEEALQILSNFYHLDPPEIRVGTVKGKRRTAYAVYVSKEQTIYAMNSDILYNPFVILHEFYHHLRSRSGTHRGTERHADSYARGFIDSYRALAEKAAGTSSKKPSRATGMEDSAD